MPFLPLLQNPFSAPFRWPNRLPFLPFRLPAFVHPNADPFIHWRSDFGKSVMHGWIYYHCQFDSLQFEGIDVEETEQTLKRMFVHLSISSGAAAFMITTSITTSIYFPELRMITFSLGEIKPSSRLATSSSMSSSMLEGCIFFVRLSKIVLSCKSWVSKVRVED